MLLAVDIGNTSTALGLFSGEELIAHFRIHTDRMRMESEYRVILKNLFALEDLPPPKAALLASVVPPVEREMKRAIERLFGVEARVVEAADTGLEVLIDNPREAGADRLVNAVGALAYPPPPLTWWRRPTATWAGPSPSAPRPRRTPWPNGPPSSPA